MANIYDLLAQDVTWEPKGKPPVLVEQMTPAHIHNLLAWFERRAPMLKERLAWHMLLTAPNEFEYSIHTVDAAESAMDEFEAKTPLAWLDEQPLVRKLRELQRAYREAEVRLAKARQPLAPAGATAHLQRKFGV